MNAFIFRRSESLAEGLDIDRFIRVIRKYSLTRDQEVDFWTRVNLAPSRLVVQPGRGERVRRDRGIDTEKSMSWCKERGGRVSHGAAWERGTR